MTLTRKMFWWMGVSLSVLALAAGAALLIADTRIWQVSSNAVSTISAAPLLLAGVSFLLVQPVIRPRPSELTKNLLLAATFLLWGAIQLMPQNELARRLGNVVVVLYVLDLAWVVLALRDSNGKDER
jgi:peptidoglycan/LPS O-acetylase OafA/YrhL